LRSQGLARFWLLLAKGFASKHNPAAPCLQVFDCSPCADNDSG